MAQNFSRYRCFLVMDSLVNVVLLFGFVRVFKNGEPPVFCWHSRQSDIFFIFYHCDITRNSAKLKSMEGVAPQTSVVSSLQLNSTPCRRCTVKKVPAPNREGGRYSTNPIPLTLGAEALITSPLSLTLEPSTPDTHLPFYIFPLNDKDKYILD